MWAVFRYSTGRILSYFVDEMGAQLYCEDQNSLDAQINATHESEYVLPEGDWGYKLMTVHESVDELCNGLDA